MVDTYRRFGETVPQFSVRKIKDANFRKERDEVSLSDKQLRGYKILS